MKYLAPVCSVLLFFASNSVAQSPSSTPPAVSELSNLQTEYDPQSGRSSFTLMDVPRDGIAYYQNKLLARQLYGAKKYAEAEPVLDRLVREYPRDPENWTMLAFTKGRLKKHLEAAAAHEQAGKLIGWDLEFWNGYYAAANYLAAGNKRAALDWLRRMVFERHGFVRQGLYDNWEQFASLRTDPEFLEIVGRPDMTGWSRDKGWTYDLDFLYSELKRVNPDYRDKAFPAELDRRYKALKSSIPRLSDEEIFIGMNRMLAVLRQGHVILFNFVKDRSLPLQLYAFPEGVYIYDAADEHKALIGSRVVSFGTTPAEETLRKFAEAHSSDGDMEYLWGAGFLVSAYHLRGLGVIKSLDAVPLTLEAPDGSRRTISLATVAQPIAPRIDRLVAPPNVEPPLFLSKMQRDVTELHWERNLPERDAMYVQVNNIRAEKEETLAQFGIRLWSELEKSKPKNLILDLRHNNGGNTQSYPELLRTLIAFTRQPENQLYVLIGRRTYSATGNFVTDLERLTAPVFVGEASSECCNLYGDPISITLPYSGIQGELTAVKWQLSSPGDRRREMSPHVPVQLTAADYFKGKDPALETVYRLIAARTPKPVKGAE